MFVFSLQFAVIRIAETDKVWQRENATISLTALVESYRNCYLVAHAQALQLCMVELQCGAIKPYGNAIVRVEAL